MFKVMKEVKQILIGNARKQQKNKGRGTVQERKDRFVFKEIGKLEGKKSHCKSKKFVKQNRNDESRRR